MGFMDKVFAKKEKVELEPATKSLTQDVISNPENIIPKQYIDNAKNSAESRIKLNVHKEDKLANTLSSDPVAKEKYIMDLAKKMMEQGKEELVETGKFQNKY